MPFLLLLADQTATLPIAVETAPVIVTGSRVATRPEDLGANVTVLERETFDVEKPVKLADVLNRPIHQVDEPVMANARGAAFQAGLALGHLTVSEIPNLVPIARTYTPDPKHRGLYDELFGEFLNLYKNNKAIFARLNRARGS